MSTHTAKEKRIIVIFSFFAILMSQIILVQQLYITGLKSVLIGNAETVYFFDGTEKNKIDEAKNLFYELMVESSNRYVNATIFEKAIVPRSEIAELARVRYEKFLRLYDEQKNIPERRDK